MNAAVDQRTLSDQIRHRDEAFWLKNLRGFEGFELRADRDRSRRGGSARIDRVSLTLSDQVTPRSSSGQAATASYDPFELALSSLMVLLYRYSSEVDIALAVGSDARPHAGTSRSVATGADTVALRVDLSGDPSFACLHARVRAQHDAAVQHLGIPLAQVLELHKPIGRRSPRPLLSVRLDRVVRAAESACEASSELANPPGEDAVAESGFDLHFEWRQHTGEDASLACAYNAERYDRRTLLALLRHFATILRAVSLNDGVLLSAIPMLDAGEQAELVVEHNRSDAVYPRQSTVAQLFEAQCRRTPDAIAVKCGEQRRSFRELERASRTLAHRLRACGVGRGSLVAVCVARSLDLPVALLAVLRAGAAYVPLDPDYPALRLAQILEDAQPAAILSTRLLQPHLPACAAPTLLLDLETKADEDAGALPENAVATPRDLAYVIFTSGSTGRPKGVQIEHQALTNLLWSMHRKPGLSADDTWLSVTTVSFDIATLELFLPLIVGARLVIAQRDEVIDGAALWALMQRHHVTVMQATPVTWALLLDAGWRGDPVLRMLCGGEALSRQLADRLLEHGGELWNLYGPTETTIWSSVLRVEPGPGPVLIGPPIANTQFYVRDRDGQLLPRGVPGELFIGGDGVARGYLNLPDQDRERFVADPYRKAPGARLYRTGDRVCRQDQGGLEFLGRGDGQVKLRGFRIELGEIEAVLRAQPQVAEAVAVIAADAAGEPALHAYVVLHADSPTSSSPAQIAQLQATLRTSLPSYMCPTAVVSLPSLPRTLNGKIDRAALPAPDAQALRGVLPDGVATVLSSTERRLADIWRDLLPLRELHVDDHFFEIGGHSILAVRMLAKVRSEFDQPMEMSALFAHPTLRGLAGYLDGGSALAATRAFDFRRVLRLQAQGSRPPLIALNNTGIFFGLARSLGADQPFVSLQLFDPASPDAVRPDSLEGIAAGYVELIRQVQPSGPCALLGWCVAGTLAFEVARQLQASGREVSQLVLFDTLVPGYLRRLPWWKEKLADYSFRWQLIAADWEHWQATPTPLLSFLAHRDVVRKWRRRLTRHVAVAGTALALPIESAGSVRPINDPEQYDQWLLEYLSEAAARYQPQAYAGSMTLVRSSKQPGGRFLDLRMGWAPFVRDGIEVLILEGDHFSIFQSPQVETMARVIRDAMDASDLRRPLFNAVNGAVPQA